MTSSIGPVSEHVRTYLESFVLLTGYMVIASPDLENTIFINPHMRLLEIRPCLNDDHIIDCLKFAQKKIGKKPAANFMSTKLGWTATCDVTTRK